MNERTKKKCFHLNLKQKLHKFANGNIDITDLFKVQNIKNY